MNQAAPKTFKKSLKIMGLSGGSPAWWLFKKREELGHSLIITATDESAETLYENIHALERWKCPEETSICAYFPEEDEELQIESLSRWTKSTSQKEASFLITSYENLQKRLPSPDEYQAAHRTLRLGDRRQRDDFFGFLTEQGYNRVDTVEQIGEMAVRGEVLDLWSPGWEGPLRLLWPFDQIEAIRKIEMATQRSGDAVDLISIQPAKLQTDTSNKTLLDHLNSQETLVSVDLPSNAKTDWVGQNIIIDSLGEGEKKEIYFSPPSFGGKETSQRFPIFSKTVKEWLHKNWKVVIFCHNPGEQERLEEILLEQDHSLTSALEKGDIQFPLGFLVNGFISPQENLVVLANGEIFGRYKKRLRLPKFKGGQSLSGVGDLSRGNYVVHERFGIGRYVGLSRLNTGGMEADYLRLEYKGGDRVFVPLFEFQQVQKFIGTEGKKPKLSSLDKSTWEQTKGQVKKAIEDLANELLARAAKRASLPGIAFPSDSHMEKEFGDSFLYDLTNDQARAIEETKEDMMRPTPMDRVICGDVGYGKTEVAMRAAFKTVSGNRQVAVLVPTTILAEQHGRNFKNRFADYPVNIGVLSRFVKPQEEKKIIQDLKKGLIDIIIGTHRLLSSDISFKNLGLIIIDEEHRFGVKQKERITAYRETVDVLALSATPIPRTLGSALGGIKSLSIIETPPEGRLPIATHVGPFNEKLIVTAIEQELHRHGQVFYVHNRVGTIEDCKKKLSDILMEHGLTPSIGLAHGKMTGNQLEKTMSEFHHKKYDILISTTIIESGLDIPSVNTLIVEEAEDFGLSQLYQLRGRVGRERQKAYCYLFYSQETILTEEAKKRLTALKEFASLGSGFKLALRDLEIRGAGNLLGPQQHGFVNAVGLDLYGQLLSDQIKKQQGLKVEEEKEDDITIEIPFSAYFPEEYLPSENERISFYKKILNVSPTEIQTLKSELEDKCGKLPEPAQRLFDVARLRHTARQKKVSYISLNKNILELRFRNDASFSPDLTTSLMEKFQDRIAFLPGPPFGLTIKDLYEKNPTLWTKEFLSQLK